MRSPPARQASPRVWLTRIVVPHNNPDSITFSIIEGILCELGAAGWRGHFPLYRH